MAKRHLRHSLSAPFSAVTVRITAFEHRDDIHLEYLGKGEDLVAAGVITAELLEPGARGRPRLDAHGRQVRIHRSPKKATVVMYRSQVDAIKMPGVTRKRIALARDELEQQNREWEEAREAREVAERRAEREAAFMVRQNRDRTLDTTRDVAIDLAKQMIIDLIEGHDWSYCTESSAENQLDEMHNLLQLAKTRVGAEADLRHAIADGHSLGVTVAMLRHLQEFDQVTSELVAIDIPGGAVMARLVQ